MSDEWEQDGEPITCANCGITAEEYFHYMNEAERPSEDSWFAGTSWYCSDSCYDEHTKDEG